ncbi:MAG TPA: sigma-54 dependent transcriptional regulator [Pyrinomonadaceae bacterium]|nr:sigma-54 dependent transcriptional regulator [Pyrinomonadaceae bacterium]
MRAKLQALVIDDDPGITSLLAEVLRQDGWEVTEAGSAEEAFEQLTGRPLGAVFCDVRLGGPEDGFAVLRRFKQQMPATPVVLMTGYASALGALDASSFGAYDYILKPFEVEDVESISRALKEQVLNYQRRRVRSPIAATKYQPELRVIGRSAAFIDVMKKVGRYASTDLPVLLSGESGTGKEVIGSSLHSRSSRRDFPFITVNCGAISSELIESELFGHVKGAFTGADRDRKGLWAAADKGTVFLDEITETSPAFQVKLLRALQQGEIRPVGSNETLRVDVRVIAASNRNVEEEVREGRFREDLFYRLNAVSIRLPPLRERPEDILLLARSFAEQVFSIKTPVTFSAEAIELLQRYPWPGNIRELENAVVLATALSDGVIRANNLPDRVKNYSPDVNAEPPRSAESASEIVPLAVMEARYIREVLSYTSGNKQAASRLLGIDRKRLDRIMKRHHISLAS